MSTSGTVGTTRFTTRKVLERAYGRCRIAPQQLTPERLQIGLDHLFLRLQAMASKGIPLWTIGKHILPLYVARQSVPTPLGTVDLLTANLRQLNRLTGTASATEGTAENAFDGDFDTADVQTVVNGQITLQLDSATRASMFGILPGVTGTWSFLIQGSDDGSAFETLYTVTEQDMVDEEWFWFDVEGIGDWAYYRLQATDDTILNVREWVLSSLPTEINLAPLNLDDYSTLPNKVFLSRPTQFWFDRTREQPILTLWPSPNEQCRFWNLVVYTHREVQDVGSLTQELEVPQRWFLPVISRIAGDLAFEDKEVDPEWALTVMAAATADWREAWDGESDSAPTQMVPGIGVYTR